MALFYKESQSAVVPRPEWKSFQTPFKLSERAILLQFSRQRVPDPRPCSGKANYYHYSWNI